MLWKGGGGANLLIILVKFIDNIGRKAYRQKSVLAEKRIGRKAYWQKSVSAEKRIGRKAFWQKSVWQKSVW